MVAAEVVAAVARAVLPLLHRAVIVAAVVALAARPLLHPELQVAAVAVADDLHPPAAGTALQLPAVAETTADDISGNPVFLRGTARRAPTLFPFNFQLLTFNFYLSPDFFM